MGNIFDPPKPKPKAPPEAPAKKPEDDWKDVPGKPHLEQNGLGQWRTKDHPTP